MQIEQGKYMGRPLKRNLLEVRTAKKKIRCLHCREYIFKGTSYTFCAIIGFWGSFHNGCFNKLSVSLDTKDTGEYRANSSNKRLMLDTAKKIDILMNTGKEER